MFSNHGRDIFINYRYLTIKIYSNKSVLNVRASPDLVLPVYTVLVLLDS